MPEREDVEALATRVRLVLQMRLVVWEGVGPKPEWDALDALDDLTMLALEYRGALEKIRDFPGGYEEDYAENAQHVATLALAAYPSEGDDA